jgi:hypothetical protein
VEAGDRFGVLARWLAEAHRALDEFADDQLFGDLDRVERGNRHAD